MPKAKARVSSGFRQKDHHGEDGVAPSHVPQEHEEVR